MCFYVIMCFFPLCLPVPGIPLKEFHRNLGNPLPSNLSNLYWNTIILLKEKKLNLTDFFLEINTNLSNSVRKN